MQPVSQLTQARRVYRSIGVAGAAVTLTLAAAAPALAAGHGAGSTHGKSDTAKSASHGKSAAAKSKSHGNSDTAKSTSHGKSAAAKSKSHGKSAAAKSKSHGNSGAAPSSGTGHNPPGNNGTVFIHDVAGDTSPHNVPHVGCTFYVDFFGFDAGQQVTMSFAGQAPTGKGTPLGGSWTGTVSTDDAGGAGNDFDLEIPVNADDLGLDALGAPQAQQGYHVKMTIDTNEPGGHKYKVFWISPCTTAGGGDTGGDQGGDEGGDVPGGSIGGSLGGSVKGTHHHRTTGGGSTGGSTAPAAPTGGTKAQVLGERFSRSVPTTAGATAPAATSLPFTGAEIGGMVAAAALALGGGTALTVAGRRRRRGQHAR